jgi:hypothetical protein
MSACCRREIYLNSSQANPNCPGCGKSVEWVVMLRGGGDPRRHHRQREDKGALYAACAVSNGRRAINVRILNYSARGMAIELSNPVPISSEAEVYIEESATPIAGVIRHCTRIGAVYIVGMEIPREWNDGLLILQKKIEEAQGR